MEQNGRSTILCKSDSQNSRILLCERDQLLADVVFWRSMLYITQDYLGFDWRNMKVAVAELCGIISFVRWEMK